MRRKLFNLAAAGWQRGMDGNSGMRHIVGMFMLLGAHLVAAAAFSVAIIVFGRLGWADPQSIYFLSTLSFVPPPLAWFARPLVMLPMSLFVFTPLEEYRLLAATWAAYLVPFAATYCALSLAWRRWGDPPFPEGCCSSCGYDLRETPGRCPECGAVPLPVK